MAQLDDEPGWINQSQRGDHEAFEALVKRHQRMIHALAYRMSGSLADAEDLAQETFIRAYQQLGDYRAEARFSSWLYRIAINICLNWKKREQRRGRVHADWETEREVAGQTSSAPTQPIQEALMKLNPKQRAAIVLTIYEGLNHADAARALGCSETTVSWRLFTARAKLKKLLAGVRGGEPDA